MPRFDCRATSHHAPAKREADIIYGGSRQLTARAFIGLLLSIEKLCFVILHGIRSHPERHSRFPVSLVKVQVAQPCKDAKINSVVGPTPADVTARHGQLSPLRSPILRSSSAMVSRLHVRLSHRTSEGIVETPIQVDKGYRLPNWSRYFECRFD